MRLDGRDVVLDRRYLDGTVNLDYVITGHLAQGMTCRQTFVLASDGLSREWAYVAMSRGRESNRLYVVGGEADERAEFAPVAAGRGADQVLAAALRRSEAQQLALDATEARVIEVQEQLAGVERRLEEGHQPAPLPRRKLLFWQREPARPVGDGDQAALLRHRAGELRSELALLESRLQRQRAAPARPARETELRERCRAFRRERGFGLER